MGHFVLRPAERLGDRARGDPFSTTARTADELGLKLPPVSNSPAGAVAKAVGANATLLQTVVQFRKQPAKVA